MKLFAIVLLGIGLLGCEERKSMQDWKPTTKLPQATVDAARFLFEHGFADPTGGTYREATIEISNIWRGQKHPLKVNAFQIGQTNRVVAWNGLEYEAKALGKEVDLAADVRGKNPKNTAAADLGYQGNAEGTMASSPNHVTGSFLLLRYGRSDLAEEMYQSLGKMVTTGYSGQAGDAWFRPAIQYLSNRYDRALAAHMRGDDKAALADFKELSENYQAFVEEADRRLSPNFKQNMSQPGFSHPIEFVKPVTALYEDSKGRNARSESAIDIKAIASKPQSERVALLIKAMSQIDERQISQPGGVSIGSSPIVVALVAEGDAAAEPLLDCMEKDKRFTRSVSFGRDFHIGRNPITVAACARVALNSILGVNTSGNPGPYWSNEQVRRYWEANKGTTVQERWYRDLQNDSADYQAWELAARNITERTDIVRNGAWVTVPTRTPGQMLPPVKGESLRIGKNPTVVSLLHRRAVELMGSGQVRSTEDVWKGQAGAVIALASYTWDPKASLPTLQEASQKATRLLSARGQPVVTLASRLGQIYSARLSLGDSGALDEYRELIMMLLTLDNDDLYREVGPLRVLWEHPKVPGVSELALKVFTSPDSPWNPLQAIETGQSYRARSVVDQPVLLVPEYRAALAKAILAPAIFGEGKIEEQNKQYYFRYKATGKNGGSGGFGIQGAVPANRVDKTIPFRVSDHLLLSMARLKGLPAFEIYWSDKQKDQARQEIAKFLTSDRDFSTLLPEHVWSRYR